MRALCLLFALIVVFPALADAPGQTGDLPIPCLLYTSDAADEN